MSKDTRFDAMRSVRWQFAGFWLLQAGTIAVLTVPILFVVL